MKNETAKKWIFRIYVLLMVSGLFVVMPLTAQAAVGDVFRVNNSEGISIQYSVLTESETAGTLQVGYGTTAAISNSSLRNHAEVTIPSAVTYNGITYTVTAIGNRAFHGCWFPTAIHIPNTIESIGDNAFYNCSSMERFTIPASVKNIGSLAFDACLSLTDVIFLGDAPVIGSHAFSSMAANPTARIYSYANGFPGAEGVWQGLKILHRPNPSGIYTVIFKDWNGDVLSRRGVSGGTSAAPPAEPVREGYLFTGWDKDFSRVTDTLTVTAQYGLPGGSTGPGEVIAIGEAGVPEKENTAADPQTRDAVTMAKDTAVRAADPASTETGDPDAVQVRADAAPVNSDTAGEQNRSAESPTTGTLALGQEAGVPEKENTAADPQTSDAVTAAKDTAVRAADPASTETDDPDAVQVRADSDTAEEQNRSTVPPTTDKSPLGQAISDANAFIHDSALASAYTAASVQAAKTEAEEALLPAKAAYDDPDLVQADADAVLAALNAEIVRAKDSLEPLAGKTALGAAIAEGNAFLSDNTPIYTYTPKSVFAAKEAVAQVKDTVNSVLDNADATQAEVDAALIAFNMAFENAKGLMVPKADKTALAEAMVDAFWAGSDSAAKVKEAAAQAKKSANSVLGDPNATQAEVDAALTAFNTALEEAKGLSVSQTDWSALIAAVTEAKAFLGDKTLTDAYTQNSVDAAKSEISKAMNHLDGIFDSTDMTGASNAAQDKIDAALGTFNTAVKEAKSLMKPMADKTALLAAITEANTFLGSSMADQYTRTSANAARKAIGEALDSAYTVFHNPDATQAEIDTALAAFNTAVEEARGSMISLSDKTALTAAIEEANTFLNSNPADRYSPESITEARNAVEAASSSASAVLNNPDAAQAEVDAALAAFNTAAEEAKILLKPNLFTVAFADRDGTAIAVQRVEKGLDAVAPTVPGKEGLHFTGWDGDFTKVSGDLTITALYETNQYTVTFAGWDGTVLDTQHVAHGKSAESPEVFREGYSFLGWDADLDHVTEDLKVTALYRANPLGITPSAAIEKLEDHQKNLIVTVAEKLTDGTTNTLTETFAVDSGAAGVYEVGKYKIHVDTGGDTEIRSCYLVE